MIYLHGIGHFHPENVISNKFLEDLDIGTNHEWIMERVGIEERRTVLPLDYIRATKNFDKREAASASLYTNAQTAFKAATIAISKAKIKSTDIGLVIAGGCSPQYTCPAEACVIASELNIEAPSFDLNSACSSLAAHLNFLQMMNPELVPSYVLIIQAENNTRTIDYSDRNSAVLWGDCTTALIVSTKVPSKIKITHTTFESIPSGWDKVVIPTQGHFFQDGRAVQSFAIKKSHHVINKLREHISGEHASSAKFIGHQANLLMLNSVCARAEIKNENHFYNINRYGNCGAAGAPSVLSENFDELQKGDRIMIAVVGSGLSFGGALLEVGV